MQKRFAFKSCLAALGVMAAALTSNSVHAAGYAPIALTPSSFTFDIVVESNYPSMPFQNAETVTMDSGPGSGNNTWMEQGLDLLNSFTAQPFGLPHAGSFITNKYLADHVYQMPPTYIGNCALFVGNYTNFPAGFNHSYQTGSLTLTTPAPYTALSLLISAGNGPEVLTCVISYDDGTTQTNSIIGPDWFGGFNSTTGLYTGNQAGTTPVPVYCTSALGRCNTGGYANTGSSTGTILWSLDIPTSNTVANATNLALTWVSGGRCSLFAISGSTNAPNGGGVITGFAPLALSGYDGDPVVEATSLPLPYNATMDNGTNINAGGAGANTWFELGWDPTHPASGFPTHGSTITSITTGRQYQMAPTYTGPMSALVDTNHQVVNITPASPQAYTAFSLLTCGASIGAANVMTNKIVLQHADGVNETNLFFGFDWFNDNAVSAGVPVVVAYRANGRTSFNAARSYNNVTNLPNKNPLLFESQFQCQDTTSPVTNIVLLYFQAGGVNWTTYVLAVSATAGGIPVLIGTSTPAQNVYTGQTASFTENIFFGSTPAFQWQRGASFTGPFTNLTDGATGTGSTISGSTSSNLLVANVSSSDQFYYVCTVTNAVTTDLEQSVPAPLTILHSTATVLTSPTDPISDFGSNVASPAGQDVTKAIDGTLASYLNFGTGGSGPFQGPVGIIVKPNAGVSIATGLRFFTSSGTNVSDPADYALEGSNDGTNFTSIVADSPLSLPDARNVAAGAVNITNQVLQEVTFANTTGYGYYRLTISNVKTNLTATNMQVAEIQILGSLAPLAPGILVQPSPTNEILFAGASTTYSVVANGPGPFTYQWFQNTNTLLGGATNATFSIANVQPGNAGTYNVVVSNAFGGTSSAFVSLSVVAPVGLYANAIVADHPIAYYRLDEADDGLGDDNTGVIANDYTGGHDGIYTNVVLGIPGYSTNDPDTAMAVGTQNTNLSFVGAIQGINLAKPTNSDGAMSIEAWVNPSQTGNGFAQNSGEGIVTLGFGGGGEQFTLDTGGTSNSFRFYFRDAGGTSHTANASSKNADGGWHHIVGVLNGAAKQEFLWVDGRLAQLTVLATNGLGVLADNAPTNRLTIGWRNGSTTNATIPSLQFLGDIDEVAIYNYALTSNQVQAHYFAAGISPVFVVTPTNETVNQGATATFTGVAFGSPTVSYQWYHSDGSNPTTPLAGQTSTNLVFANAAPSLNGTFYQLVVTNSYGGSNSPPVQLTVVSGPPVIEIDLQPQYAVYSGYPLVLTATAGGTPPLTYQWTLNTTNLSDTANITGSHSNTLTIATTSAADSGTYQLLVSNGQGTTPTTAASVTVLPVLGFNGLGNGWASQGTGGTGLFVDSNVLQVTFGTGSEANSSFFGYPVYVGGFIASFTYQNANPNGNPADGAAFVIQNDARGAAALGGGGGALGYTGITNSAALEFDIYSANANGGVGISFDTNGAIGNFTFPAPVIIGSGDPIGVMLTYLNGVATLHLTDSNTLQTFSTSVNINIPGAVGGKTAFVGFTGGDGGSVSTQLISNFSFISLLGLSVQSSGSNLIVTWPTGVGGYVLQSTPTLTPKNWTNVTQPVSIVAGMNQVTIPESGAGAYFRLVLP